MADRSGDERWEVVRTAEFDRWLRATSEARRENVTGAMERLANMGPTLGRPRVDSIKGSRVHNLKELRCTTAPGSCSHSTRTDGRSCWSAGQDR